MCERCFLISYAECRANVTVQFMHLSTFSSMRNGKNDFGAVPKTRGPRRNGPKHRRNSSLRVRY
jgi:hypothetical protein